MVVVSALKAEELNVPVPTAMSVADKILPIGETYQNNITLLDNRFRIDAGVDRVILVFFREFGTTPVVLVKPNGSKLFLENDSVDDSYSWFESDTYDMIELIKPMPGPWQALGQILPNSRVMVIADLILEAESIPTPVFSGETIKHTAFLRNAGTKVNFKEFRDVVTLSIDFISTNHPDHENFGLGAKNIARFEDNGIGLDEMPGDGTFTGEFDLNITNGEWQPVFSVRTPLFSREQTADVLLLLPNPIRIEHIEDQGEDDFHRIIVDADPDYIDNNSLLIEGTVRSPEGETERFSSTDLGSHVREFTIMNSGFGIYRVTLTAYAKTIDGRDVVLDVPEYAFITRAPVIEVVPEPEVEITKSQLPTLPVAAPKDNSVIMMVLGINFTLLLLGGLIILAIADMRRRPDSHVLLKFISFLKNIKFKKTKSTEPSTT
ncbi:TIGR03503 family protein [Glaciecola sp. SC05]|uniref:TIGR03503 family protein n=1 Tax=Glaciecola sp. SC05 TaxID=1987355 RepID=UPI0035273A66